MKQNEMLSILTKQSQNLWDKKKNDETLWLKLSKKNALFFLDQFLLYLHGKKINSKICLSIITNKFENSTFMRNNREKTYSCKVKYIIALENKEQIILIHYCCIKW